MVSMNHMYTIFDTHICIKNEKKKWKMLLIKIKAQYVISPNLVCSSMPDSAYTFHHLVYKNYEESNRK